MPTNRGIPPLSRKKLVQNKKHRTDSYLRFLLKVITKKKRPKTKYLEKADKALQEIGLEEACEFALLIGVDPVQENRVFNVLSSHDLWTVYNNLRPHEWADYSKEEEEELELDCSTMEFVSDEEIPSILDDLPVLSYEEAEE